jgi:hypothetical protein
MKRISLICVVLFALSAVGANQGSVNQGNSLGVAGGRYVFGQVSDSILSTFMLDTQTGRLWKYQRDDQLGLILVPITYRLINGKANLTPLSAEDELEMLHSETNKP